MPKRVKKIKQKQKQKQSQQVIVKIDQSRRTVQRKVKDQQQQQQQRLNIAPVINLPSYPHAQMQQEQAQREKPASRTISEPTKDTQQTRTPEPVPVRTETAPIEAEAIIPIATEIITPTTIPSSIPSAFKGASQRIGNITEPTARTQFQPESDNSLGAYFQRQPRGLLVAPVEGVLQQRQPIQPGEAEAQQSQNEEDDVEYAELPAYNNNWIGRINQALQSPNITEEDKGKLQDFKNRYATRKKTSYSEKEKNLINKYL